MAQDAHAVLLVQVRAFTEQVFILHFGGKFEYDCRNRWRGLWVVLQESYVLGISPKTGEVRVVMLFDKGPQLSRYFSNN